MIRIRRDSASGRRYKKSEAFLAALPPYLLAAATRTQPSGASSSRLLSLTLPSSSILVHPHYPPLLSPVTPHHTNHAQPRISRPIPRTTGCPALRLPRPRRPRRSQPSSRLPELRRHGYNHKHPTIAPESRRRLLFSVILFFFLFILFIGSELDRVSIELSRRTIQLPSTRRFSLLLETQHFIGRTENHDTHAT